MWTLHEERLYISLAFEKFGSTHKRFKSVPFLAECCLIADRLPLPYNPIQSMKAQVTVMLKTTVLDPQGKTIHGALKKMGYKGVAEVRQGKFFELQLDGAMEKDAAKAEVERIAREVLTNPVIEEFSYRLEE